MNVTGRSNAIPGPCNITPLDNVNDKTKDGNPSFHLSIMRMSPRRIAITFVAATCSLSLLWHIFNRNGPHHLRQLQANTIQDNLLKVSTLNDLPPIPALNIPPDPHVPEKTPLLIGFSQNWPMLQQAVVSYLVAGWPATDIYVVDNTGTMFSNRRGQLTIQNPSFLDYHRLEKIYQVNVISTPSLLSFAQLQNFYIHEALVRNWSHFFWSHMDVVALSTIDVTSESEYLSLYRRAVSDFRTSLQSKDWAIRFYAYDRLALVSVSAFDGVGGWDPFIPYYSADCDMYERLNMAGYHNPSLDVGQIFDVAIAMEDVGILYEAGWPGSASYEDLYSNLTAAMEAKFKEERNTWQGVQQGGKGEPYFYGTSGREICRREMITVGRKLFQLKWGTSECRLYNKGIRESDAWPNGGRWWTKLFRG